MHVTGHGFGLVYFTSCPTSYHIKWYGIGTSPIADLLAGLTPSRTACGGRKDDANRRPQQTYTHKNLAALWKLLPPHSVVQFRPVLDAAYKRHMTFSFGYLQVHGLSEHTHDNVSPDVCCMFTRRCLAAVLELCLVEEINTKALLGPDRNEIAIANRGTKVPLKPSLISHLLRGLLRILSRCLIQLVLFLQVLEALSRFIFDRLDLLLLTGK